jgi:hypothetical protein
MRHACAEVGGVFFGSGTRETSRMLKSASSAALLASLALVGFAGGLYAAPLDLEKEQIKLGFIKLTAMAPFAIAYGIAYDGRKPNAYLDGLAIGLRGAQQLRGGEVVVQGE